MPVQQDLHLQRAVEIDIGQGPRRQRSRHHPGAGIAPQRHRLHARLDPHVVASVAALVAAHDQARRAAAGDGQHAGDAEVAALCRQHRPRHAVVRTAADAVHAQLPRAVLGGRVPPCAGSEQALAQQALDDLGIAQHEAAAGQRAHELRGAEHAAPGEPIASPDRRVVGLIAVAAAQVVGDPGDQVAVAVHAHAARRVHPGRQQQVVGRAPVGAVPALGHPVAAGEGLAVREEQVVAAVHGKQLAYLGGVADVGGVQRRLDLPMLQILAHRQPDAAALGGRPLAEAGGHQQPVPVAGGVAEQERVTPGAPLLGRHGMRRVPARIGHHQRLQRRVLVPADQVGAARVVDHLVDGAGVEHVVDAPVRHDGAATDAGRVGGARLAGQQRRGQQFPVQQIGAHRVVELVVGQAGRVVVAFAQVEQVTFAVTREERHVSNQCAIGTEVQRIARREVLAVIVHDGDSYSSVVGARQLPHALIEYRHDARHGRAAGRGIHAQAALARGGSP